jgi:hypothetical protein
MAKKGLFAKVFGKQGSDCCNVSFEAVDEAAEGRESERGSEERRSEGNESPRRTAAEGRAASR